MTLKIGGLFAGYGGLDLAIEEVFNAELAWFAEFDPAPSKIMAHHYPELTNYGDVTAVDWSSVPPVDIISGGSPCQDLSLAGARKGMATGTRSNLWESMREAIATIKPTYVVWENVRGALSATATSVSDMGQREGFLDQRGGHLRALGRVLGDLADLGYDCQWRGLRAADVGAPHGRFRVFVLATRREGVLDTGHHAGSTQQGLQLHPDNGARKSGQGASIYDPSGIGRDQALEHDGRGAQAIDRPSLPDQPDSDTLWARSEREAPADTPSARPRGREDGGTSGSDAETQRGRGSEPQRDSGERTGTTTADADSRDDARREQDQERRKERGTTAQRGGGSSGGREALADADGRGCEVGQELDGNPAQDPTNGNPRWGHPDGHRLEDDGPAPTDWGPYAPAIRRWEAVRGTAPAPTELTAKGKHRLSAKFAEWLMGVDPGWITDVPGISRNDMLKAAGNGVVPQQAAAALRDMLNQQENQ